MLSLQILHLLSFVSFRMILLIFILFKMDLLSKLQSYVVLRRFVLLQAIHQWIEKLFTPQCHHI